ncbi:hypothetical protein RA983_21005, partial [Mycobacteroides abscessus subsp. abscessus]
MQRAVAIDTDAEENQVRHKEGIDDFLIIDKNAGIGGTWWANTYPGVAVDIPSIYYSFSYEPPKKWTRMFAPGREVQQYAEQVVDSFGLRPKIRLNTAECLRPRPLCV